MNLRFGIFVMMMAAGITANAQRVKLRTVYDNGSRKVSTVTLTKKSDHRELLVPMAKLKGIDTLEVQMDFLNAKEGEDGYYVFSDGYMTRFLTGRPDTTRALHRNHRIAMAGAKTPRGCWLQTFQAYRFHVSHEISCKNGVYSSKLKYILKDVDLDEDLVLRIYSLEGDDADYSGMGRLYRKLFVEGKVRPLAVRAAENPLLKYAVDYPEIRIRQAWKPVPTPAPEQTRENEPSVRVKVTFDRCCEIVNALKKGGVDGAQLTLVGWNLKGHDGRFPTVFPPEITLGGDPALRKLIKHAQSEGYQIVPHICTGDSYRVSEDFDERDLVRKADGTFDSRFIYGSGRMHQLCNKVSYEKFVQTINDSLRAYGFRGVEYNDVYSTIPPVTCHSPEHPLNDRESTEYAKKILADGAAKIGGIGSEGGYDHVAEVLDFALYVTMASGKPDFKRLKDEYIPIWHLIYNGYIYSCPFSQSVNYSLKPVEIGMKVIEYGCHPTFYYYSAHRDDSKNWIGTKDLDLKCETEAELEASVNTVKVGYDYLKEYGYIQYLTMDRHEKLAPSIYMSTFSDGTRTVCNYSAEPFVYEGVEIAPAQWHIFKAANDKNNK